MILGEPRGPKTELRIGPESTKAAVEPSGLKLIQIVEVPPYHTTALCLPKLANVRSSHLADIPTAPTFVRYWHEAAVSKRLT